MQQEEICRHIAIIYTKGANIGILQEGYAYHSFQLDLGKSENSYFIFMRQLTRASNVI